MSLQQSELVKNVQNTLFRSGYITSKGFKSKSSCFDLAARREKLLFIKCLLNVDNFNEKQNNELKHISAIFTGSPVLIGERNKHKQMEKGVVYNKNGIPTVDFSTFQDIIINNLLPFIYAKRGGYFVKINEGQFEKERSELDFSLNELAARIGVSKKTIYSYERGKMDASLEIFNKLKQFFKSQIEKPIDLFSWQFELANDFINNFMGKLDSLRNEIDEILLDLGLRVFWAESALFDGITSEEGENPPEVPNEMKIITGLGSKEEKNKEIIQKIQQIQSISQVIHSLNMFITEDKINLPKASNIPIIEKKKLEDLENKKELIKKISKLS